MWSQWVGFNQHLSLARHVSDLIGPSSGAFCTSCIRRLWYVVIRVLLDTSSRYKDPELSLTNPHFQTYFLHNCILRLPFSKFQFSALLKWRGYGLGYWEICVQFPKGTECTVSLQRLRGLPSFLFNWYWGLGVKATLCNVTFWVNCRVKMNFHSMFRIFLSPSSVM